MIEAVANHHQPVLDPQPRLSAVAHVANCIAHLPENGSGSEACRRVPANARALESLGLDAEALESLGRTARADSDRVEQVLTVAECEATAP